MVMPYHVMAGSGKGGTMRIRMGILAACFCWLGALSAAAELSRYVPEEAFLAVKADGPRIWGLPQARRLLGLVEAANPKVEQVLMGDFASAATADYLAFAVSGEVRILIRPADGEPEKLFRSRCEWIRSNYGDRIRDEGEAPFPYIGVDGGRLMLAGDHLECVFREFPEDAEPALPVKDSPLGKRLAAGAEPLKLIVTDRVRSAAGDKLRLPPFLAQVKQLEFVLDDSGKVPVLRLSGLYPDEAGARAAKGALAGMSALARQKVSGAELELLNALAVETAGRELTVSAAVAESLVGKIEERVMMAPAEDKLRQIGVAIALFVSEEKRMPDSFDELYRKNFLTRADVFRLPGDGGSRPPADGQPVGEENCSFYYWGRGIPAGTAVPSRIPVAAMKRRLAPKGRFAVLFLDGHVEVRQTDSPDEAGLIRGLLKDEAFDGRREIESLLLKNRMEE